MLGWCWDAYRCCLEIPLIPSRHTRGRARTWRCMMRSRWASASLRPGSLRHLLLLLLLLLLVVELRRVSAASSLKAGG